jgi:hypothetical protein
MALFLGTDQLLDPKYRVTITLNNANGNVTSVSGNLQSDLVVSGSNRFGDSSSVTQALGLASGTAASAVSTALGAARTLSNIARGQDIVNIWETEAVWSGTGKPTFEVDLTFICLDASDPKQKVVDKVNTLMRAVYPDAEKRFFRKFTAPLGYNRQDTPAGKIDLAIGDFFFAQKLIIEGGISFTYSKSLNRNGEPLYAVGKVALTPYRAISYREFLKYFKTGSRL